MPDPSMHAQPGAVDSHQRRFGPMLPAGAAGIAVLILLTGCSSGSKDSANSAASAIRAAVSQASAVSSSADDALGTSSGLSSAPEVTKPPKLTGSDFCVSLSKALQNISSVLQGSTGSTGSTGGLSKIFAAEKQALIPVVASAPAELAAPLQHVLSVVDGLALSSGSLTDPVALAKLEQQATGLAADSAKIEAYIAAHCKPAS
jgi:hypothetical protein